MTAIRENTGSVVPHEIIVLANGVSEETALPVKAESGVRLLRSRANLGFGGGCNWASRYARGTYLVLLNDDALVEPGWLEGLVGAAESNDNLGAVGSLVLTSDHRVQEAGRVLWRDGVSHGIADGWSESKVAVLPVVREVDSCSGCSLLIRRSAWDAVNGFDERYFPAYYEDIDLTLSLRTRGWAVACTTASRVRHHRSASTPPLWRRFLGVRNHGLLLAKWSDALECFDLRPRDRPTAREVIGASRGSGARRRALYHRFGVSTTSDQALPRSGAKRARGGKVANDDVNERLELLEREVAALEAQLRLKDEYIAHLDATAPQMEHALDRLLRAERRRALVGEWAARVPLLKRAAHGLRKRIAPQHKTGAR